jgi:oligosaccharide reducing-end xylanase
MFRALVAVLLAGAVTACGETIDVIGTQSAPELTSAPGDDLLDDRIGVSSEASQEAIVTAFQQLFFGDPNSEAVYRETDDGSAYIEDILHGDVRTDSMGYGMFVAVQLDEMDVFDKLWSWARQHMLKTQGPRTGQLNWKCLPDGSACEQAAATDATSVLASTLFMAEARWGAAGAHDYEADANTLIDAMVLTEERNEGELVVVDPFDVERALPRAGSFLDDVDVHTDYLMPAFYEYWSMWRPGDAAFWLKAAREARSLLREAPHEETGLVPRGLNYDGTPAPGYSHYDQIAARTLLNLALDEVLFGPKAWVKDQTERRLDFFLSQGVDYVVAEYSLSGVPLTEEDTSAHVALVALAAASSTKPEHSVFLDKLWAQPIPNGKSRYYNGMLYLLSLVVLSGNATAPGP